MGNDEKFPIPLNIYENQLRRMKNQIFFSLTLIIISALICLGFLHSFLDMQSRPFHYSVIGVVSAWFYSLIILWYLSDIYTTICSAGIVSTALVCGLDYVDGRMTWAWNLAVPLIVLVVLVCAAVVKLYKRFKHKNQYVVIPIYLCVSVALVCPVIEMLIDYRLSGVVGLSWSVLVFIPLMTVALGLLALYLKLPERMRDKIRKKLHI